MSSSLQETNFELRDALDVCSILLIQHLDCFGFFKIEDLKYNATNSGYKGVAHAVTKK